MSELSMTFSLGGNEPVSPDQLPPPRDEQGGGGTHPLPRKQLSRAQLESGATEKSSVASRLSNLADTNVDSTLENKPPSEPTILFGEEQ